MVVVTSSIHKSSGLRPSQRHRRTHTKLPKPVSRSPPMGRSTKPNATAQPAPEKKDDLSEAMSALVITHQVLDSSISGTSSQVTDPVAYLTSPTLLIQWKSDLNSLLDRYLRGDFPPDVIEKWLQAILPDVEYLRKIRDSMEKMGMVDDVWEAIDQTCQSLQEVFEEMRRGAEECDRGA